MEKFKMENKSDKVEIVGLNEIVNTCLVMENIIGTFEKFTEDVLLSCLTPDTMRFRLEKDKDSEIDDLVGQAYDALQTILVRYRKIVSWMRTNNIDIDAVIGDDTGKIKS